MCHACVRRFGAPRWRCQNCAALAPPGQARCDACTLTAGSGHLGHCVAAVDYAYPWDTLVARLKFKGEPAWARTMADLMLLRPEVRTLLAEAQLLIPVPLSARRLAERGYNQAWEIGKAVRQRGRLQGLTVPAPCAQALLRRGDHPDQHTLSREQRWRNLRQAFEVNPRLSGSVSGRRVLLVDDVSTTGATLQMAARVLRRAGAAEVNGLVFARTDTD
ncbi:MAG: ComF family protein [Hydrogenophaga sp.]|nr:ComF family protein [Hydrogenophaga sp.]